jgi:predicted small secreted protein
MRLRTVPLAAAVLAAGFGLTACNDNSGTGAGADSGTPEPARSSASSGTAGSSGSSAPSTSGGTGDTGGSGKSTGGTTGGGNTGGGIAAAAKCRTSELGFAVDPGGEPQGAGGQGHVTVTLTNKGTAPCALNGYPGVDLMSSPGDTWSLTRQTAQKPRALTLSPGGDAFFKVTYLPYTAEGNTKSNEFKTATMTITPPGETESKDLPWPHKKPVLRQDGATHPGTYVGPVTDR